MLGSTGSWASQETQPSRGRLLCQVVAPVAARAALLRRTKPSTVPARTRLESDGATLIALTKGKSSDATTWLAADQLSAASLVRHSWEPPIHSRSGFEGSITKGVMKRKLPGSSVIPSTFSVKVWPPSVDLRRARPGVEA